MTDEKKFFIAGVQHHRIADVIAELEEGDELLLIPEPTNKFDPNAIRIQFVDTMLGYVPKKFSSEISALIEAQDPDETYVGCFITMLNKRAKPWEMCEVTIRIVPEAKEDGSFDYDDLADEGEEEE